MKISVAKSILQQVHADYNTIAADFSATRQNLWPELLVLKKFCRPQTRILDYGCGNGRLVEFFKEFSIDYVGADQAEKLIEQAKTLHPQNNFLSVDGQTLPLTETSFDQIWSIAVYHEIPSRVLRKNILKEFRRILKPNGQIILTVWNLFTPKYLPILWQGLFNKFFKSSGLDFGDVFIPWKATAGQTVNRYYHAFSPRGLKKEIIAAGFSQPQIIRLIRNQRLVGWAIIAEK